jgi:hypothetical protein
VKKQPTPRTSGGKQPSDAPGAAFPHPGASAGDAADPIPPDLPTTYLDHAEEADRPARRRRLLERARPRSPSAPSGGP